LPWFFHVFPVRQALRRAAICSNGRQKIGRRSAGDVGEYSMEVQGDGTPKKIDGKNEELIAIGLYP